MRINEDELIAKENGDDKMTRERYSGYDSQDVWQKHLRLYFDGEICGALNKKKTMCRKKPMSNGRCKYHGGASLKGMEHPNTITGKYSKYLPDRLAEKYEEADNNADLMSLRDEMALITARLYEISEKMNETAGKKRYGELFKLWEDWKKAVENDSKTQYMLKLELEHCFDDIKDDLKIWKEVESLVNTKRKLVDSEQRKLNNLEQYIPVEKVMLFVGAVMGVVSEVVEDLDGILMDEESIGKTISKISRKIDQLSNRGV